MQMTRIAKQCATERRFQECSTHLAAVVPEEMRRRFRGLVRDARQVDVAALLDEQLGTAQNGRLGHCRKQTNRQH